MSDINHRYALGFTLVELIITIVVIGILSTVAYLGVSGVQAIARDKTHENNARAIVTALEAYYGNNGEYPTGTEMNPNDATTELSAADLNNVKSILPELGDSNLSGPQNYTFFPYCSYGAPCANNPPNDWPNFHAMQYIYLTVYTSGPPNQTTTIDDPAYGSTSWGCGFSLAKADPGYVLAYRRELDSVWVFYKSKRGTVTLNPGSKACTFSKL